MSTTRYVPAMLAELMAAPVVPGAACHRLAPEWDSLIPGEHDDARWARLMAARRACRRCPGLARCLERLEELDDARDVVMAGEVRDVRGRLLAPRWRLADVIDPSEGQGRPDHGVGDHGHRAADPTHSSSGSTDGESPGRNP